MKPFKMIFGEIISYYFMNSESDDGLYCRVDKTIKIRRDLKGRDLIETKLHEEFHAIWDIIGMSSTEISAEIEEIIVHNFSRFIVEHYDITEK